MIEHFWLTSMIILKEAKSLYRNTLYNRRPQI